MAEREKLQFVVFILQRELQAELLQGEDYFLPIGHRIEDTADLDGVAVASTDLPIPDYNKGFQMLQRMGWRGQGLGRDEQGDVAIPLKCWPCYCLLLGFYIALPIPFPFGSTPIFSLGVHLFCIVSRDSGACQRRH